MRFMARPWQKWKNDLQFLKRHGRDCRQDTGGTGQWLPRRGPPDQPPVIESR
jgi:hypothetical protein